MRQNRRFRLWLACLVTLGLLLTACGGNAPADNRMGGQSEATEGQSSAPADQQPAAADPNRGTKVLKIAMPGEPPTLDLHIGATELTRDYTLAIYETPFTLGADFSPIPHLVDTYQFEDDGKKLIMKFRADVPFHNGEKMTADDVVASLSRWGRLSVQGKEVFQKVTGIEATEPHTVVMTLSEPMGVLLFSLASPHNGPAIYPKSIIDKYGDEPIKEYIGTGPYKLAEHVPDRHVKLVRFDEYNSRPESPNGLGGKREAITREILLMPVAEASTRTAGLETGQYHFALVNNDDFERLGANPDITLLPTKPYYWAAAVFNKKKGPMTNPKLRLAFNWALNKQAMMQAAFGPQDLWRLDAGLMPPESFYHSTIGEEAYRANNPDKAKQLIQEAGYNGEKLFG